MDKGASVSFTKRSRYAGLRHVLRRLGQLLLAGMAFSVLLVLALRWIDPPTSSVMLQKHVLRLFDRDAVPISFHWMDIDEMPSRMGLAVIAAEDQRFALHHGFDFKMMSRAFQSNMKGRKLRGASTITQQTAKNLFLWSGRNYLRKGLEAWFTVLMETLWSKRRILEVYLNVVQFGDGVYGVESGAGMLGRTPQQLSRREAARLAAVLPSPRRFNALRPSAYVEARARWIENQMWRLQGDPELKRLLARP